MSDRSAVARLRALVVGRPRDLSDGSIFHKVSLVALLAWVGLGADGLSSSCYGPEETFKALGAHVALAPIIALMCVGTIVVICASYRQIIELFPGGGGGYLVASKLLSPTAGVVSGSALLVDYVLTIAISVASGGDAFFSLVPPDYQSYKLAFSAVGIVLLTLINLRGVRESVTLFAPVFFLFILTHGVVILLVIGLHLLDVGTVVTHTTQGISSAHNELGLLGIGALLLRAFSVGAGTYTGIEAVSNGLPVLREPRAQTGKKTMLLMGASLAVTVFGLLLAYLLENISPVDGKTLNAVLFEKVTASWPGSTGHGFVLVSMVSATALLIIAAQAGFLDGPRVLANMAIDRWFPTRFATLSDRFVTQNGILLMGAAALLTVLLTRGNVGMLVVLYSINVFLTFSLSQLGMVRHWWINRAAERKWRGKLLVNGVGLIVTTFILVTLSVEKFAQGGWVTVVLTASVVALAVSVKRHYLQTSAALGRLENLVKSTESQFHREASAPVRAGRTAVVLVNGYNGLGLHTLYGVFRMFPSTFSKFTFVQVGAVDAGSFKGKDEIEELRAVTQASNQKYVDLCKQLGLEGTSVTDISIDPVQTIQSLVKAQLATTPAAVIFGGQLAFARETVWTRWLHNYVVFALQRVFCREGYSFVIVPARV